VVPRGITRRGFARNELLEAIGLCALVFVMIIPALHAVRDALEAEPRPTARQVVASVAWGLVRGVVPVVAVLFLIGYGVNRLVTFRPGTRVRVTHGPWAGAEGVVAPDHNRRTLGPVAVVLFVDGVERREKISSYDVRKSWLPRWL
jgi:hypothetical protein